MASIFELEDKFGKVVSPFGDWLGEQQAKAAEKVKEKASSPTKSINLNLADTSKLGTTEIKEVFLTFDDGLQPGTQEVLLLLEKLNVTATFFLTGIHVKSFIEKTNRNLGLKMLKEIYTKHQIANHSYSHANDYYENYYSQGLKIGKDAHGKFIYRTVLKDFQLNDETINKYLVEAGIKVDSKAQYKTARFPGRNTWWGSEFKDAHSDTKEEAQALYNAGYSLYGWDTEWNMNFEIVNIAKTKIQSEVDKNKLDWSNEQHTHPFYDLYKDEYINKDRVTETYTVVLEDIEDMAESTFQFGFDDVSRKSGKVILLMHERAFRYGKDKDLTEILKLGSLILALKDKGFSFKRMNEY